MKPYLQLHIARIAEVLGTLPAEASTWLSPSEQARLQRLKIPSRRDQYLSGHWLARCLIAEQHGGKPQQWLLQERPSLPPAVIGLETPTHLSLSHSGDWIACALSDQPIGIDIEQRQPPRTALLRFQHLLLAEGELPDTLSTDQLLQRWVAKEAWIKRHHGSALPEHLAAVRLHRATAETANVRVDSWQAFHLGISTDGIPPKKIDFKRLLSATTSWHEESTYFGITLGQTPV